MNRRNFFLTALLPFINKLPAKIGEAIPFRRKSTYITVADRYYSRVGLSRLQKMFKFTITDEQAALPISKGQKIQFFRYQSTNRGVVDGDY